MLLAVRILVALAFLGTGAAALTGHPEFLVIWAAILTLMVMWLAGEVD